MLLIPANLWTIIIQNNGFEGIKPTPNPKPNTDGTYTVTLNPAQWQIFQENQKRPPIAAPALEPGTGPSEKPSDDSITVTNDPSTSLPAP